VIRADSNKLRAYNMSPDGGGTALSGRQYISPSGNVRIGDLLPMVPVNSVVGDIKGLNDIPIRSQGTQTVFIRDIGKVEDSSDIQTGYALVDGRRTVYIPVTKGRTPRLSRWFKPSKTLAAFPIRCCRTTSPSATNSTSPLM